ncbi:hypothetical protein [Streptomyces sp. bgisy029]|uniref:hypothetical protein n=1 Tax=Streptomyces sp. bgisy029 TaxID=3413771 RepID=UPI003D73E08C
MIGPIALAAAGIVCIAIGIYAAKAQGKMVSRRAGEANAAVTRNTTRIVWLSVGAVFLVIAAIGVVGEVSRA